MGEIKQPDLHHEGPITAELCDELIGKLDGFGEQMPLDRSGFPDWDVCRNNWIDAASYAKRRLREVKRDLESSRPMLPHYHGRIVDCALCVVRDFNAAKALDFKNPDFRD